MPLNVGDRLAHYDVTALIGEGGMGQVYQATDTKLNRQVALKILPEAFATDPDRLARFEREAKVLASLNHPGIAAIYGIEEQDDTRALVLELVEGPTLADRIAHGPIPVDEALPIAKQIAEALEAAHEAGVIHRDLKPANIKVREDGTVKVLDFGLAKALDTTPTGDPSESPTLTAAATQMGVIMGTAAYMAPEQAKGKVADKRADVWAFGVVLYEMLTGRRVFEGADVSEVMAGVIKSEPEWEVLPAELSPVLLTYLQRCLQKDPRERIRDIGDVRLAISGAFDVSAPPAVKLPTTTVAVSQLEVWQRPLQATAIGLMLLSLGIAAGRFALSDQIPPNELIRFVVAVPTSEQLTIADNVNVVVSPDGRHIAYLSGSRADVTGSKKLLLQSLDGVRPTTLASGSALYGPFFSPNGEWVGIYDLGERVLRRVSVQSGTALKISDVPSLIRGASWGDDDTIVFATQREGLWRVAAGGGVPEPLTAFDGTTVTGAAGGSGVGGHFWPAILPGGQDVLFTVIQDPIEESQIAVLSLDSGEQKVLIRGSYPRYSPTGHLLYGLQGNLWAVGFDLDRLETVGDPDLVQADVVTKSLGGADFDISDNGRLVYVSGGVMSSFYAPHVLVWIDRQGLEEPIDIPVRPYYAPRLSPDGNRVAVEVQDENTDIWVHDLVRGTQSRLTFDPGRDRRPVWTPDGERIAFSSDRGGLFDVFWKLAIGTGQPELVASASERHLSPSSWTPDGQSLLLLERTQQGIDIGIVTLDGDQSRQGVLEETFSETSPEVSPDGRWLAYGSSESGQREVYVRPFPDVTEGKWQVSTQGGQSPAWSPDGRELFYRTLDGAALLGVTVETEPTFRVGIPEVHVGDGYFFGSGQGRDWDVSPDGQRFLMLKNVDGNADVTTEQINVVLNWFEELKRLVPTN